MKRILGICVVLAWAASSCSHDRTPLRPQPAGTAPTIGVTAPIPPGAGNRNVVRMPRDFATLQEAVAAATEGQKIDVRPGEYSGVVEVPVRGVWLHAQGPVVLNGAFHVTADGVTIDGFTVRREGAPSAIAVEGTSDTPVSGVVIRHNVVLGEGKGGIDLDHVTHSLIAGNVATGGTWGISLAQFSESHHNVVRNNRCSGNMDGIVLHTTSDNRIELNVCSDNSRSGIDVQKANHRNIIGPRNVCDRNAYGIDINHASSTHNVIRQNQALGNEVWDIEDLGTDNRFFNNHAETTTGVTSMLPVVQRTE